METVTVTPTSGLDSNGDPVAPGSPVTLTPLEIAPGNTVLQYGIGGDLDDVEFTVYFPPRVRTGVNTYAETATVVADDYGINVRGRDCRARVAVWRSQRGGARGGVAVLCRSATGQSVR
ncbi:hypothetical protein [Mycolicibacterium elephantis]|uniref:hypothetical protein n=1 Tax=Mycolicibacterium elephantis TaxID=81858 RepID=UPI000A60FBBB|nr:hypothetical protein [Mycolicibacterium elephantis]